MDSAIDRLSIIWESDRSDIIKRDFFKAVTVSILLYGCISKTQAKCLKKKVDENHIRRLLAVLNKFRKQHPTKQQLYGHLPLVSQTIQIR